MHSTNNIDDGYLGSGTRLRKSIRKYGKDYHEKEILEFLPDRESLVNREKEIVNEIMLTDKRCMNLMKGGKGGFISDSQQKYRSQCGGGAFANRLKNDKEFAKKIKAAMSENLKQQYKDGRRKNTLPNWTGKIHKEETKKKMSETHKKNKHQVGETNSQFGTAWITNGKENKKIKKEDLIPKDWYRGMIIKKFL